MKDCDRKRVLVFIYKHQIMERLGSEWAAVLLRAGPWHLLGSLDPSPNPRSRNQTGIDYDL